MDDCISRKAAIEALADYIHNVDKAIGTGHLTVDDCKDAATSVFEELPSVQPEQRWIPCNWQTKEENLPQECKSVLICMKDSCGYRIGVSYRTDYNRWEGYGRVNVIAWMPLPEPYAERRTDAE